MTDTEQREMGEELLPCPFCGGAAKLSHASPGNWFAQCQGCRASSNDCGQDRAVNLWNTRALTLPADPVAVKALTDIVETIPPNQGGTQGMIRKHALEALRTRAGPLIANQESLRGSEPETIDSVPSCGQENDYRRASPALPRDKPVAWRMRNDYGYWWVTTHEPTAATYRDIEKLKVEPLYTRPENEALVKTESLCCREDTRASESCAPFDELQGENEALVKALEEIDAIFPARQSAGMACQCELCQIGNIARAALSAHRSGT